MCEDAGRGDRQVHRLGGRGAVVVGHRQRDRVRALRGERVRLVAAVDAVPVSPKLHAYDAIVPSGSRTALPSKVHDSPVQLLVNAATGGWFGGGGAPLGPARPSTWSPSRWPSPPSR